MHDFEWQESDRAITIRCQLPPRRRRFLAALLCPPLLVVVTLFLSVLLPWWQALHAGGIPWRDIWPLLQTLSSEPGTSPALAVNLLCALPFAWLIRQAALFTPDTTLHFDKRERLLTISQEAPALRPNTITVPFDAVKGVSPERWREEESSDGPQLWFLEMRFRDGRRFRTPATQYSEVLESCALRIRNGALTTKTIGVPNPPRSYKSGVRFLWLWAVMVSVFLFSWNLHLFNEQRLDPNGSLTMARLQQKSSTDKANVQLRYTFVLPNGREIDTRRSVSSYMAASWKEGDWMAVRYDRREPEQNLPVLAGKGMVAVLLAGNLLFMSGLANGIGSALHDASPGKPWGLWPRDGWC